MVTVEALAKEFYHRHDFESDDVTVLHERYPSVLFHNIPEAWVVIIDDMLNELQHMADVTWVKQHFGFLTVQFREPPTDDVKATVRYAEERLYRIDVDLHKKLDCKVVS